MTFSVKPLFPIPSGTVFDINNSKKKTWFMDTRITFILRNFLFFYHIQNGFFTLNPFKKLNDIIIRMLNVRLVSLIVRQCAGQIVFG